MGGVVVPRPARIAGRIDEQRQLETAIQGAADGRPRAVFVHGEAGVGKTCLIEIASARAAANGFTVLWGRCVRFGSVGSPYLPLVGALKGWLETADAHEKSAVLGKVPDAGDLLPSAGGLSAAAPARLLTVLDSMLAAIASCRPTVLVVDDAQWADNASYDALSYLVAGFRSQRLAILATYRDEELVAGHPMHGWLADLRRMPSVADVRLDRLTADETAEQLALLIGDGLAPQVVDEVVARSDGNPYLSELLIHGLTAADEHLPADLPSELTSALLAAWHRLSAQGRDVMRVLAVAGRPSTIDDLTEVVGSRGIDSDSLTAALIEATTAGIVVALGPDTCWFRHPLLADVLYSTFVPGEAASFHAAWTKTLESRSPPGIDEVRRQGDLALHYEAARNLPAALQASLRAADLAATVKARREEAVHLQRAARLWPRVHDGTDPDRQGEVELLERVGRATATVGDSEASLAAWSHALELVDARTFPLHKSRLLTEWCHSAWSAGRINRVPMDTALRAVELCRGFPESGEHAEALANLSQWESWSNEVELAQKHGRQAVEAAQLSGAARALSLAHGASGLAYLREGQSSDHVEKALQFARMLDDPEPACWAYVGKSNYLRQRGRINDCVVAASQGLRLALDVGAPAIACDFAGILARDLLVLGRLPESTDVLREGLALAGLPNSKARGRLAAMLLSVRRGELEVAKMHLDRARELISSMEERPGLMAPPIVAEYFLSRRQPDRVLDLVSRTLTVHSVDSRVIDEMVMLGARAAADLAVHARDQRDPQAVQAARQTLDDIVSLRRSFPTAPFDSLTPEDLTAPAQEALFVAEYARCAGEATSSAWENAVRFCDAAEMRWEQGIASWRWAQALADEGAGPATIATPLRAAHRYAVEMGAAPLQHELEGLATLARIPLKEKESLPVDRLPAAFVALTKRELEVLSHLVAGHTYVEIAHSLFISEKTVSVHVSNLLRKTGTSSRREVSALARRLDMG